jgi:DNA-binding MarR family transcriptional regulator
MPECRQEGEAPAGGRISEGGFLLGKASRLSEKRFARILRDAGLDGLEPGQGRLVFLLWQRGSLGQGELASLAGLDKSSLALLLARLEEKGLVERSADVLDARRAIVRATPAARTAFESYREVSDRITSIFYRGFDMAERRRFEEYLGRIIDNLEG